MVRGVVSDVLGQYLSEWNGLSELADWIVEFSEML